MNDDLISRQAAILAIKKDIMGGLNYESILNRLPSAEPDAATCWGCNCPRMYPAEPTLRERALMLLLNWVVECGFGYDNFPEEYERYKDEIEDMSYIDGMIYIAEKEVERNG